MREEARGILHILINLITEMKERLKTVHKHSEHILPSKEMEKGAPLNLLARISPPESET